MSPTHRRRGLVAVWAILAVLVGIVVVVEYRDRLHAASTASEGDPRRLLPVPVERLGAVEVADAGRLHRFERDATGAWLYHGIHTGGEGAHSHTSDPAVAARIERTMAAFGRTRVEREFPLDANGADYGVTAPHVVVLVYGPGQSQPLAQYAVGQIAPDTVSRYVLMVGRRVVVTIPDYQVDNLLALVRTVGDAGDRPASSTRP